MVSTTPHWILWNLLVLTPQKGLVGFVLRDAFKSYRVILWTYRYLHMRMKRRIGNRKLLLAAKRIPRGGD